MPCVGIISNCGVGYFIIINDLNLKCLKIFLKYIKKYDWTLLKNVYTLKNINIFINNCKGIDFWYRGIMDVFPHCDKIIELHDKNKIKLLTDVINGMVYNQIKKYSFEYKK